ncbi:lantibiotic dehydratase C-terminal domain-containing protein [Jiulongibacter sediminis]|uniref:lantibiotic dehydratase C-terminal domain-containing protein n=1 Tax=Jiulongibacter sediminis TaxID=1605367 RepID=UPI0038D47B7F
MWNEFGVSKSEKRQLDQKFRLKRQLIEDILTSRENELYDDFSRRLGSLLEGLEEATNDNLVSTFIHMSINRFVLTEPRRHEMIIYDMISRFYRSAIAKMK